MDGFTIPVGDVAEKAINWVIDNMAAFFDLLRTIFIEMYDGVYYLLGTPHFAVIIGVVAVIALLARGWQFMLGSVIGLVFIVGMDQWDNAMVSLALVLVATFWALVISLPLGIWAARSTTFSNIVRPFLDFLQTMPAFVYLIPAILLLGIGAVPGIVATIVFSLAPGARFTELGIRSVDTEVLEAGQAFGASPGRILRQIQFPLALPTIMAGINQVIMLSLSMVVIAGMVGAGGLGAAVYKALTTLNTPLGVESGLSVVVLAIVLDRITASFGQSNVPSKNA